jgi:HEAT repeat protein
MATNDFQTFLDSAFGSSMDAMRDGPDLGALSRLQGYERDEAERMMIEKLSVDDNRPTHGLGLIRSQKALPRIRELMKSLEDKAAGLEGGSLVALSLACFRIDGDPHAIENIIKVLETSTIVVFRQDAIRALYETNAVEAKECLLSIAENDEEPLLRNNAAKALLLMAGKIKDMSESPQVTIRLMFKPPHIRAEAVRELKAMLGS